MQHRKHVPQLATGNKGQILQQVFLAPCLPFSSILWSSVRWHWVLLPHLSPSAFHCGLCLHGRIIAPHWLPSWDWSCQCSGWWVGLGGIFSNRRQGPLGEVCLMVGGPPPRGKLASLPEYCFSLYFSGISRKSLGSKISEWCYSHSHLVCGQHCFRGTSAIDWNTTSSLSRPDTVKCSEHCLGRKPLTYLILEDKACFPEGAVQ